MTKYESKVVSVQCTNEQVYKCLSNINHFRDLVPKDKVRDWKNDETSCSFSADMVGQVSIRIVETEPFKLVKLEGEAMGKTAFNFWIQLKEAAPYETKIKLTFGADIPMPLRLMLGNKLQDFVNTLADQFVLLVPAIVAKEKL